MLDFGFKSDVARKSHIVGLPYDPVAWYKLKELSGTVVTDASSNAAHGTAQNIEDSDWVGSNLYGLVLDGVNEDILIPATVGQFDYDTPFSFEATVTAPAIGAQREIFGNLQNAAPYRGWRILLGTAGRVKVEIINTAGTNAIVTYTTVAAVDGTPKHIVCTYDGSHDTQGIKIYMNAVAQERTTDQNNLSATTLNANTGRLGSFNSVAEFLGGTINNVVFYDFELNQAQINYRYNHGVRQDSMNIIGLT